MSDPVLDAINALRVDVATLRAESSSSREQIANNQAAVATCSAHIAAVVASLEQHRADDRRELDGLAKEQGRLRGRQWLMAVVVAVLGTGGGAGAGLGVVQLLAGGG